MLRLHAHVRAHVHNARLHQSSLRTPTRLYTRLRTGLNPIRLGCTLLESVQTCLTPMPILVLTRVYACVQPCVQPCAQPVG